MSEGPNPYQHITPEMVTAAQELHAEIKRTLTVYDYDATNGGQFDLWRDVFPEAHESRLQYGTIYRLENLAATAGGWWHFPDANNDDLGAGRFYETDEWIKMNSRFVARM